MGTNFYFKSPPCAECEKEDAPVHIGKSSAGWCFSLHVIPELGINSLDDWKRLWEENPNWRIEDEYGQVLSREEMLDRITNRSQDIPVSSNFNYSVNEAEPGPRNLLRHRIGRHCIGHGAGTWDLIVGQFS